MTSTPSPDTLPAAQADATQADNALANPAVAKAPGFASLFSAARAAAGPQDNQPWHQKGNKSSHEKKIGPAPNGTRRAMGKR